MDGSDGELVFRCLEGDHDAFAVLVRRYQGAVHATAQYYAGRYGGTEDICQDAFWTAFRSLPHLKDPERFGAWLKGITTRVAANWLRRNAKRQRHETPLPHRRIASLEEGTKRTRTESAASVYDRVHQAIDALPERYRLAVVLRYVQELSYDEISRFTGESRDEIRGVLNRANKHLRELLSAESRDDKGGSQWPRAYK